MKRNEMRSQINHNNTQIVRCESKIKEIMELIKKAGNTYDVQNMIAFMPNLIRDLTTEQARLEKLNDENEMLQFFLEDEA